MTELKCKTTALSLAVLPIALLATWTGPVRGEGPGRAIDIQFELSGDQFPFLTQWPYVGYWFGTAKTCGGDEPCYVDATPLVGCQSGYLQPITYALPCPDDSQCCAETSDCAGCTVAAAPATNWEGTESDLMEKLVATLCEKAALQAQMDAREQFDQEREELLGSWLEAVQENAKLQAQVDVAAERQQLHDQLLSTLLEKAKLEAALELAGHKQQLVEQYAQGMLENQRLKLELAALERESAHNTQAKGKLAKSKRKNKGIRTARQSSAPSVSETSTAQ